MFDKIKTAIQTHRAFSCLDKNNLNELSAILDSGFDINTVRLAKMQDQSTKKTYTMSFDETLASRAFREEKWDALKMLIARVGVENFWHSFLPRDVLCGFATLHV